jgi:hypothetical protein
VQRPPLPPEVPSCRRCGQPWARARFSLRTSPLCPMWTLLNSLGETGIGLLKVEKGSRPESGRGRRTSFVASLARNVTLDHIGRGPGGEPIVLRQPRSRLADNPEVGDWFAEWAQSGAEVGDLISYSDNPIADQLRQEMNAINQALDEADIGGGGTTARHNPQRGLTGRIEFFWPGVPYPGLIVRDLAKGARLRVIEEDRRGPALKEWPPPKMCRSQEQHPFDEASGHVVQT